MAHRSRATRLRKSPRRIRREAPCCPSDGGDRREQVTAIRAIEVLCRQERGQGLGVREEMFGDGLTDEYGRAGKARRSTRRILLTAPT